MAFYPLTGVNEGFKPWGAVFAATLCRVEWILPREESTLQVRHHGHVATICAGNTGYAIVRTIGIGRIALVGVFEHHIVVAFGLGKLELAFSVRNPDAQTIARETLEEYAAIGLNGDTYEAAFKLVAVVVEHVRTLFVFGIDEIEFHHELTTVADTEREGVGTCIEAVECFLSLRIEEEGSSPSLGTAKHVTIGETTTEDDEVVADLWAKDILISNNDFEDFINTNCFSDSNIRAFAKIQEIAPGIVVGRLQKEGYIKHSMLNNLKEHYEISV